MRELLISNIGFFSKLRLFFLAAFLTVPQIAGSETIRVAYEEFFPYSYTDNSGAAVGFSIDILRRVTENQNLTPIFIAAQNPTEVFEMLESGHADATSLLALTPERLKRASATHQIGSFVTRFFALKSHDLAQSNTLPDARIGLVRGSLENQSSPLFAPINSVTYAQVDDLILPLLTGEIDAVHAEVDSFTALLRQANIDRLVSVIAPHSSIQPHGFFVSPTRPDVRAALNDGIETQLSPQTLKILQSKWFGTPSRLWDQMWAWWALGLSITALIVTVHFALQSLKWRRNSARLHRENTGIRMLMRALDSIKSAIVIYDKNYEAIHWNDGFEKVFPQFSASSHLGMKMHDFIKQTNTEQAHENRSVADTATSLSTVGTTVKKGQTSERYSYGSDGSVHKIREFALGLNHFASISVDVTALHKQRHDIANQAIELENKNAQLNAFASIAAHDLKAPLVKQKMLLGFIEEDMKDANLEIPTDVQDHFHSLTDLSTGMRALIVDLLEYARTNDAAAPAESMSSGPRLQNLIKLTAVKDGFDIGIPNDMPDLTLNPTAFDTVMRNLISNAVNHHDKVRGNIRIRASADEFQTTFEVEDDGPGIPERYRSAIFEPFKRLSNRNEGSGLGLALVRNIVESWGGRIQVTCEESRGSTFTFTVPHPHLKADLSKIDVPRQKLLRMAAH